ncbi:MAG TPA: CotH kinase family protein [Saprospiraceae bacterium]|nr:CotH kinase family protein [Saprospiraceae bacterium]HPI08727.1 CotH kinase family protein [Saprospiraceae bacterium]
MKSILFSLLLTAGCIPLLRAQTDGDNLFNPDVLHEIRFESPTDDFLPFLINTFNSSPIGEIPYISGTVRIDGVLIPNVGVRIKGGISAYAPKRPLKIDFNKYVDDQEYDGITKLNLQNADYDLTVQREAVVYDMFRKAGVKAPRTAFAKVYFNDHYNGVYIMVEQVDKNFLRNYFADDEGTLYKNKTCELVVESGPETFEFVEAVDEIAASLSGDAFREALENTLATDAFLRYFLLHHFINAVDSPIDVGCNYYIYHEPRSGLIYWIPWDYNLAFYNGANYSILETNTYNTLFNKMMSEPYYRDRYLHLACDMLKYVLNENYLYARIDHHGQLIRDALMTDPFYTNFANFDLSVEQMKALIANRKTSFLNDLGSLGFECPDFGNTLDFQDIVINEFVATADSSGGIADPDGGYPDWLELYNNSDTEVSLDGYYLSNDRDFLKHWAFPSGTQIGAGEYLIVWADRDVHESGLHADFKLDKDGGQIFLSHEDYSLIDSVEYTIQSGNIASARIPNGTGPFTAQAPTFNANNTVSALSDPEELMPLEIEVRPQPAVDWLSIQLKQHTLEHSPTFQILNTLGQNVGRFTITGNAATIDVRYLNPGVYYLNGTIGMNRVMKKILISRK